MPSLTRTLFSCPFIVQVSPDGPLARERDRTWQQEFGLVRSSHRAAQIDAWRSDLLMARTYPHCTGEDLVLMTNFVNYFFNLDDQFDGALGRDPERAHEVVTPLIETVRRLPGAPLLGDTPAIRGIHNLWQRVAEPMSPNWRSRFTELLNDYLRMYAWESANRVGSHVPDLPVYIEKRRPTSAVGMFVVLAERAHRTETPSAIWQDPGFCEMFNITIDHVAWTNDVFAHRRETSRHDVHNIVLSIQRTLSLSHKDAIDLCVDMVADRIRKFLVLKQQLPTTCRKLQLNAKEIHAVEFLVECGMESWMSANIDWTFLTNRYAQNGDESLAWQEDIFSSTPTHQGQLPQVNLSTVDN
jgi:hypothetical protein